MRLGFGFAVQKFVRQFLESFKAQKRATHHQQRRHQPGCKVADGNGRWHQNRFVDE